MVADASVAVAVDGVAARAVDDVAVRDAIAAGYAAVADVFVNAAVAAAPVAVLLLLLILLLRFLFMLLLFVLIIADVGAVAADVAAALASDGASGVAVWLERGNCRHPAVAGRDRGTWDAMADSWFGYDGAEHWELQ